MSNPTPTPAELKADAEWIEELGEDGPITHSDRFRYDKAARLLARHHLAAAGNLKLIKWVKKLVECLDQCEKEERDQGAIHDANCIVCAALVPVRAALAGMKGDKP